MYKKKIAKDKERAKKSGTGLNSLMRTPANPEEEEEAEGLQRRTTRKRSEKLVAIHASRRVIIVDETKPVPMLGGAFALPIEIVPFGHETTIERLKKTLGIQPRLRMTGKKPFISDEGHYIVDCPFPKGIDDPRKLNVILDSIVGVVESGLFIDLCDMLIVGTKDSVRITEFERQGQRKSRGHEA
jgi:hypothetical protein